jgi:pSer/pThr/pTyr-binding forkhead associated (FHA) protein
MNYVLQVVRGRSASTTLKLNDNVTSLGRHDDCVIRIKSSQVSRRHCELFEVGGQLMLRDLGSSNGTYVNGKRVAGEQPVKHGDELTVGAVTFRVAKLGQPASALPASPASQPKAGDTAVVDAVEVNDADDGEEFEMEFDDGEPVPEVEGIPLADDLPIETGKPKASATSNSAATESTLAVEGSKKSVKPKAGGEDDAVADFLLELDLDDDD